jgi:hypothetical protein
VILYSLAVLAATIVAGLIVAHRTNEADEATRVAQTRAAVERITKEVHVRRALETADLNSLSWPKRPDPEWFGEALPANELLDRNRPWLEIAPASQAALEHPPVRVATDESLAAFWYNPYLGVVRARAPERVSDRRSMELYGEINATRVAGLLDLEWLALDAIRREGDTRPSAVAATNLDALEDSLGEGEELSPLEPARD